MDGEKASRSGSPCSGCLHRRVKADPHLAEQGLIECRSPAIAPSAVLDILGEFVATGRVDVPFSVMGDPLKAAWPLQFDPAAISRCDGREAA